jgi:CRISPR-associated protein Cas1
LPALDAATPEGAMLEGSAGLNTVRGLEGAAAAAYFAALATVFPPALNFTGRNRRPPRDPVNACLSLGYTLLHFEAVRACHGAGLDPLLGFFHDPAYGRESLACDLIEPLRPRLDAWVWGLFRNRLLRAEQFVTDKGACLLNKSGRQVFYASYEVFVPKLRRYLRQQAYRLARELPALAPEFAE